MKAESNIQPKSFEIENIKDDRCEIVINANIQKIEEDETIKYAFDSYRLNICYNKDLKEEIESNYEKYLEIAKNNEEKELATEIRKKRDELLKETDQEMCIDRMGLEIPNGTTFSSWLSFFRNFASIITEGKIAKYRQALRDIPQQEGFPYNVVWPNKEDLK